MSNAREPSYDESVSAIHNRLFFRLFQAGNTLDRQSSKELGITPITWSVLGALSRPKVEAGMSFSDLTEYLVVSRQSLDGVLKRLEGDEHVKRIADTVDRRAKQVVLTAKGRIFWNALQPKIYEFYRQALEGLRFDDKVALLHFINKLNEGMISVSLSGSSSTPTNAEKTVSISEQPRMARRR